MKLFLILAGLLFSQLAFAEADEIIRCKVANKEWTASVALREIGEGVLKFQKSGDERFYGCALRLESLSDRRLSANSNVTARFTLGDCDPDIYSYEKDVLRSITLIVNFSGGKAKSGVIQWLTRKQPDDCVVEKMNLQEVAANARKSAKGQFGRRPASTPPKKIKKKF